MKMKNKQKKLHQQFKVNGPGRNDTQGVFFFFQRQAVTGRGKKKKIEKKCFCSDDSHGDALDRSGAMVRVLVCGRWSRQLA